MKLNITIQEGKNKIRLGTVEDHAVTITMTREVFAKFIHDCITGNKRECDVRDFTEEMWKEFDLGLKKLHSEN